MSVDADRVVNLCVSLHELWSLPAQIAIALYLLYTQVRLHSNGNRRCSNSSNNVTVNSAVIRSNSTQKMITANVCGVGSATPMLNWCTSSESCIV